MATSQNGYSANDRSKIANFTIPGTTRKIALRKGDTAYLLLDFLSWFDKNIESIDGGQLDDWGYAERPVRGSTTVLSNHASGTGVDVNAPRHPLGKRGTFTPSQVSKIRKKLVEYEGCIRWGGEYDSRADEMHFEVNRPASVVTRVAAKIRRLRSTKPTTASRPVGHKPGSRTLKRIEPPMAGEDVLFLQNKLRAKGNKNLAVTGEYDQPTADLAGLYKENRGIVEPGFGRKSWDMLLAGK